VDRPAAAIDDKMQTDLISNVELNEAALSACENLLKSSFWLSSGSTIEPNSYTESKDKGIKSSNLDNEVKVLYLLLLLLLFSNLSLKKKTYLYFLLLIICDRALSLNLN
jgi:hypothetical protein